MGYRPLINSPHPAPHPTHTQVSLLDFLKRALVTEAPTLFLLYHGFRHFGTVVRGPLPGTGRILRDWLLCWLWTETTFYWSHRCTCSVYIVSFFGGVYPRWYESISTTSDLISPPHTNNQPPAPH